MNDVVLVVDAARARWFAFDQKRLVERRNLVDPERQVTGHELFSESKPGRRSHMGGRDQGLDDRRDAHMRELERRFARRVREATNEDVSKGTTRIVLAANARMLGHLRPEFEGLEAEVVEVDTNLGKQTRDEIQDALCERGIVPARPRL